MVSNDSRVFRSMKMADDGLPVVGRSARMLGVRIDGEFIDIPVTSGRVQAGSGGMSVATCPSLWMTRCISKIIVAPGRWGAMVAILYTLSQAVSL